MASGNSTGGSIQSSSSGGGDEEYDSRTQSISSSFFNQNPPNFASFLPHDQNQSSAYYSSHSNNIIPSAQNLHLYPRPSSSPPNFHFNNDINVSDAMIWPAGLRSEAANSTTDPLRNQSLVTSQPNAGDVTKNPKKRTRASRRAPTTVLTTDTTNFRQMVQEFTGIPTAPFPGSPYPRRMNLLSGAGTHLDGLGPLYSLRPTLQNIVSPFSSSSSSSPSPSPSPSIFNATMIDAIVSTTNIVTAGNKTGANPAVGGDLISSNNSPLRSDQGLLNLQHHLHPSLHGHRIFEPSGSISFGNYPSDFRDQDQIIASAAAAGDFKINDDNITAWRSGESAKNDGGIQEKFMPFDGKI